MTMRRFMSATLGLIAVLPLSLAVAQRPPLSSAVRQYVRTDSSLIALTHARVIDGTGAAARDHQTLIMKDGTITALRGSATVAVPPGALVMDLTGKSVIPGLVQVHEHLYYPTGGGVYANVTESFTRLYLDGGVTSMRTAARQKMGPWIDATAPYLEGAGPQPGAGTSSKRIAPRNDRQVRNRARVKQYTTCARRSSSGNADFGT